MGLFLSSIKNESGLLKTEKNLNISEPLTTVKQYHGIFKSVCDTFIITRDEFREIFGSNEKAKMWDPEESGKADALQIFCGLIIFAKECSFRNKLNFLFSIFDFNEIKSISFVDLEVMVISTCNSIYKILQKNAKTNEPEISEWLEKGFSKKERIKITKLFSFSLINEEMESFFNYIGIDMAEAFGSEYEKLRKQILRTDRELMIQNIKRLKSKKDDENELRENFDWHYTLLQKLIKVEKTEKEKNVSYGCEISWVYGMNKPELCDPYIFVSSQEIFYVSSSVGIIYNIETNSQKIYKSHKKFIKCMAYNPKEQILVTAQSGAFPRLDFWTKDLTTVKTIHSFHREGIKLMNFIINNTMLVTVGNREDSPILIYSMSSYSIIYKLVLRDTVKAILSPLLMVSESEVETAIKRVFCILSQNRVYHICLHQEIEEYDLSFCQFFDLERDIIKTGCSAYMNISNPYISSFRIKSSSGIVTFTGHQSGCVRMISNHEKYSEALLVILPKEIVCIRIAEDIIGIGSGSKIYIYEVDALLSKEKQSYVIEIYQQNCRLLSCQISFFSLDYQYYLVMTKKGDFLKIECPQLHYNSDLGKYVENQNITRIQTLLLIEGDNNRFCLLEREPQNELILCATSQNRIFGIDSVTHVVEDAWQIGQNQIITALDAVYSDEGICYVVCGCKNGKLFIRIDWEEFPKFYDCANRIMEAKISQDCSYLLVITQDNYILFFSQMNKNFTSPRKLLFENEIPICINYLDNFKFFIVFTSAKNSYVIEIPQLKHKNLQKESEKITISKMDVKYPYENNKKDYSTSSSILGGDLNFSIITSRQGIIYFFRNSQDFKKSNYLILDVHHCPISQIFLNEEQSRLYSLGSKDKTLIEWKILECEEVENECRPYSDILMNEISKKSNEVFERMRELAVYRKLITIPGVENKFYFKGTKIQNLNETLYRNSNQFFQLRPEEDQNLAYLQKRAPNISLSIVHIYGIENLGKNSLFYYNNGTEILSFCSRFIIRYDIQSKEQIIYEPTEHKISCIAISSDDQILFSIVTENPSIYILFKGEIPTTHTKGIMHLTLYQDFILSYGICNDGYSINLHNYKTKELLHQSIVNYEISEFIFINEKTIVSLNEVRVWKDFCPSSIIIQCSSAALLPNKKDLLLGGYNGDLLILTDHKLQTLVTKGHEKAIDFIKVRSISEDGFELITIGRQEKIKIWSGTFECKSMIPFREGLNFVYSNENLKSQEIIQTIRVLSMSIERNKILLYFHMGKVFEIETFCEQKNFIEKQIQKESLSQANLNSEKSLNDSKSQNQSIEHDEKIAYKWDLILQTNISTSSNFFDRKLVYSVHPTEPLLATSLSNPILLIREYNHNQTLLRYFFKDIGISVLNFSPNGKILVIGFNNGEIRLYECKISKFQSMEFSLKFCQVFHSKVPSTVINIEFSTLSTYFAFSYISNNVDDLQKESKKSSYVQIYKTKQNSGSQNADAEYYYEVDCIENSGEIKQSTKFIKGIYYMSFIMKNDDKAFLLMYEQYFNENKIRVNNDNKGKFKVYNIEEKVFIKDEFHLDWSDVAFPNSINIIQSKKQTEYFEGLNNLYKEQQNEQEIIPTTMMRIKQYLVYGMNNGRIHLVKENSLFCEKDVSQYQKEEMNLSKMYACQTSFINKMQLSHERDYLFVSGVVDECIVKYKITYEHNNYDLDNTEYQIEITDPHSEYLSRASFDNFMNNVLPIREEIQEICLDVEEGKENKGTRLEPVKIFGRRAFDRRNNLFYNGHGLVYTLGPNIVVQDPNDPFNQEIITSPFKQNSPQISAFNFSNNYLVAATEEEKSKIFVWDILSKTCLCQLHLDFSIVYHIAQSTSFQIILLYGINSNFEASMQMIDWEKKQILGSTCFPYSGHWKIKDICEIISETRQPKFVSCGIQHLCCWDYKGSILTYSSFSSSNKGTCAFQNISFMVVRCFRDCIVTACENGCIYLWRDYNLIVKKEVHNATIRTLLIYNDLIYSAGMDAIVGVTTIGFNEQDIDLCVQRRIEITQTKRMKEHEFQMEYDIQSLTVDEKEKVLYIGTRSGSIYSHNLKYSQAGKKILDAHDNEDLAYFCFDVENSSYFFMLTFSGLIEVWSLKNLQKLFTYDLDKKSQKIFSFGTYLMVCCEKKIITMKVNYEQKSLQYVPNLSKQFEGIITECILSKKSLQQTYYLALSLKKNETNEILVNQITDQIEQISSVLNLKYKIQYMDFSVDQRYLLFKDSFQELGMINLENFKRINTIFVEMNIEWESEGLRISPDGQRIYYSYSRQNKITAIEKLNPNEIIVGDEMGTIRIFDYPCSEEKIGELHTSCYTSHMNLIKNIKVHPNEPFVMSNSSYDRSVILWRKVE